MLGGGFKLSCVRIFGESGEMAKIFCPCPKLTNKKGVGVTRYYGDFKNPGSETHASIILNQFGWHLENLGPCWQMSIHPYIIPFLIHLMKPRGYG